MSIEATKSSRFLLHLNQPQPQQPGSPGLRISTTSNTSSTATATAAVAATMSRPSQQDETEVVDTSYLFVILDRFISASTGDDVTSSLQSILDTLTKSSNQKGGEDDIVNEFIEMMTATTTTTSSSSTSAEEDDIAGIVLTTLLHIYSTSQFPKNNIFIEDGISMVGRIYTMILQRSKNPKHIASVLLLQPPNLTGRFIEACIDVASATVTFASDASSSGPTTAPTIQPYPRVLALQLIQSVASHQPSVVQHQLLCTPNGIHRLGDLLVYHTNPNATTVTVPEEVQLAMITLSVTTLSKWSSVAKIWIFNEIIDHVIRIAIQQEGGIFSAAAATAATTTASSNNSRTNAGNFNVVMDCLLIIQQLLSHDTTFGELVIQSSTIFINNLYYNIFDLRNGANFRNPPTLQSTTTTGTLSTADTMKSTSKSTSADDDDDDLDDLIASASTSKKVDSVTATKGTTDKHSTGGTQLPQHALPMLTDFEEQMIHLVLDILCTLFENPKIRTFIIQNHVNFCTLLWEMGLLTIPMGPSDASTPTPTYTCAIPSVSLQQRALHVIGTYLNSITILEQHIYSGYDRLLYLVCTGMGGAAAVVVTDADDAVKNNPLYCISQAALYVVRQTIPKQTINDLLMYTLAPPPAIPNSSDDNDDGTKRTADMAQNNVTIVAKLLRTVCDNLFVVPATTTIENQQQQPRLVCLSGALGALSLFLTDDVNRSILFRITTTTTATMPDGQEEKSLIHSIFHCLVQEITSDKNTDDYFIATQLLRFLGTWITDTPEIVQVILNDCTQSMMQLSQFVVSGKDSAASGRGDVVVSVLIHLLFGLCLHSMSNVKDKMNNGGWTRSNIVSLLQRNSKVSQQIDMVKNMKHILPWSCSTYEWNIWTLWYSDTVRIVRQRIIQELVNSTTLEDNAHETVTNDDNHIETIHSLPVDDVAAAAIEYRKEAQTMRNIVTDLTQETERLRLKLNESEHLVATQDKQLATWKQRAESTPTELDDMLNAITSKNDVLERTIEDLRDEVTAMKDKHVSELAERDATIDALRNELSVSKAQENEVGLERDSLRDDMMALSQAYTNLETEYRQQVTANAAVPSTSEVDVPGEGIDSNTSVPTVVASSGSTEVSTLRAENERMRQEAQAADEWMSMAVERMAAMTNEIAVLQEQVAASASIVNTPAVSSNNFMSTVPDQLSESQANEIRSLQKQVEDMKIQISSSRSDIEMISQRETMEISIRDARIQELESTIQNNGTNSDQIELLQQEIRSLHDANDSAQDWMSKAVEHHQALAEQISSLTEQNMGLNAQLTELKAGAGDSHATDETLSNRLRADIKDRDEEIKQLKESITRFQTSFEEAKEQGVTIAELERDLVDVRSHLDHVSSQLESKERELERIHSQLQASSMDSKYEEQSNVVESLQIELANRTEQVNLLIKEIAELRAANNELQQKVDDIETIRIEAGTKEEEILGLRARMAESDARKEAIQKILEAVAKEKEELTLEFDKNQLALEKIESELTKMRRGDLDATQSTEIEENLVELQSTIKMLEAQLVSQCDEATSVVQQWEQTYSALQSDYNDLDSKFQVVLEEKANLEIEIQESRDFVAKLQLELHALRDAQNTRISELESLSENLKDQLADQERDYNDTINQWQESYNELESKLTSANTENAELSLQLVEAKRDDNENTKLSERIKNLEQELLEQEKEAIAIVAQWQDSYNAVEAKLQEAARESENLLLKDTSIKMTESSERGIEHHDDQLAELVLQIKNLEEQLLEQEKEASEIVLQWQESYNALEATLKATIEEKDDVLNRLSQIQEIEGIVSSDMNDSKGQTLESKATSELQKQADELTQKVTQLEEELASHEEEANNVVKQWQQCYNDAVSENETISMELQSTKESMELLRSNNIGESQTDGSGEKPDEEEVFELKSLIRSLEERLQRKEEAIVDALEWQEKFNLVSSQRESMIDEMKGLEDNVEQLHQQIANQAVETNRTVEQWQQSYDEMTSKCFTYEKENSALSLELKELKESYTLIQEKCDELSASAIRVATLEKELDESALTLDNLQQQLDAVNDIVNQWQESHSHVTDELKTVMLELQERRDSSVAQQKQVEDAHASVEKSYREVTDLKAQVDVDKETILFLEEKVKTYFLEVQEWQRKHNEIDEKLNELSEENVHLRSTLESMEKEHDRRIKERDMTIFDWQQKHAVTTNELKAAVERSTHLQTSLDALDRQRLIDEQLIVEAKLLKQSVSEKEEKLLELEQESKSLRENLKMKQESIAQLEEQLVEQEDDARNIVMQWQESYEALQVHCEEMLVEMEALKDSGSKQHLQPDKHESPANLSTNGDSEIDGHREQIQLLEAKVEELQSKLTREMEHAQGVIAQWQMECSNVSSDLAFALGENEELAERLRLTEEAINNAKQQDKVSNVDASNELQGKVNEVVSANDQLHLERRDLKNEIEALLKTIADRDIEVDSLRVELSEQHELETRLNSNIAALESRITIHLDENDRLLQLIESHQSENIIIHDKLTKLTEDHSFQIEKIESDRARTIATCEDQQKLDKEKIGLIELEVEGLRVENASLAKERDQLSVRLTELDDKLMQANDTVQILTTDLASNEATEIAAEALREEVRSMYHQAQIDRTTIENLSQARDEAETEAKRLQNDIATFLGFDNYEANQTAIEKRTMEVTESLQRSERNEIRALKSSLSRALDELAISRSSEQESEDRAAKAMHQASMFEQELVSLKSDFEFLTQTMDEMRESESSRRLSLEYRISSLENEQNVLRHFHTTEMEHVRDELNHVSMERDRLFQSLKESERSKAILQQATSHDRLMNGEGNQGPLVELNRLRMEKAQLLSTAADEASRMEHRLREAHAAAKASADAEIFMERELRTQAEKALERNLIEMSELRMVGMDKRHGSFNIEQLENQLENAHNELQKVRNETQALRTECSLLRQQLHDSKKEANITIVRLTEECRVAKARCSYIEKETQREAEIRVEMARIQGARSSSTRNTPERGVVLVERNNPASDDDGRDSMAVTKLYDALQKQKQATEEERVVYFELLNEHDNLLALLAQQDLLKTSYQRNLLRLGGNDAVNTAIREAEEQAQKQYGKYIQLK